jgi:hypothetical protein
MYRLTAKSKPPFIAIPAIQPACVVILQREKRLTAEHAETAEKKMFQTRQHASSG